MPAVPDQAHSSPAKKDATQTPDAALSERLEDDDDRRAESLSDSKINKRKAPPPAAAVDSVAVARPASKRAKPSRGEESNYNDDDEIMDDEYDRKLPAKETARGRNKGSTGRKSAPEKASSDKASRRSSDAAAEAAAPTSNAAAQISTKHLLIGKGSQVWNARLRSILPNNKGPPVTTMELLQQAQERLGLAPTRFPPRESPLHSIFQSTTEPKGDRKIFECLEECYREMLTQDVDGEEKLREEYKNLKKTAVQQRIGKIFGEENRLKKKEQAMLAKLKGWVSSRE